jgi:hypothetical protein
MVTYTDQVYSGTATASGNTHSTPVLTKYAQEATVFLKVTAASGSSPTLDVLIQVWDPYSDDWYLLGTFSQKSTTGTDIGQIPYGLGEKIAIDYTIGGTNPSFTFQVNATMKELK